MYVSIQYLCPKQIKDPLMFSFDLVHTGISAILCCKWSTRKC
jgi:hypothetical protein